MLGLIGVILSLVLLIVLAYRGINVILLAPLMALLAALLAGAPLLATYTQVFMPALGKYVITYFPLFFLGALFGKLMDDSGSARAIAYSIVDKLGAKRAILAIVISCAILTYGGVSLFVVAFAVYPIAAALFREARIPKRFIPAAIALGSFTFTMTALPGTPAIQNAIPIPFFGTNSFSAPILGIIASLIMFGGGVAWLSWRSQRAMAAGEGYLDGALMQPRTKNGRRGKRTPETPSAEAAAADVAGDSTRPVDTSVDSDRTTTSVRTDPETGLELKEEEQTHRPNTLVAYLPIIVVIAVNFAAVNWILPAMDVGYLKDKKYGSVELSSVAGIWAIIVALVVSILLLVAFNWSRLSNPIKSFNDGTTGSFLPIFNTASEVGYGAVIAALPAFAIIRDAVLGISANPLINLAVAVNVIAGITGSASGGMSIALQTLGAEFRVLAEQQAIPLDLMHRVTAIASGGFDALPHNGAVITLLAICGLTHRQSYKDIGVVAIAIPVLALVVVIILGTLFGSF